MKFYIVKIKLIKIKYKTFEKFNKISKYHKIIKNIFYII